MIRRARLAVAAVAASLSCGLLPAAATELTTAPPPAEASLEPDGQVWLDIRFVTLEGKDALDLAEGEARPTLVRGDAEIAPSEPIATSVRVRRLAQETLDERLDDALDDGDVRVLARTSLLTSSGATAEFDGGGLTPVAQPDAGGVVFRSSGAHVVLQPSVHTDGSIQLTIRGEMTGGGIEIDDSRTIQASERLRHGETLFVTHLFEGAPSPPAPRGWFARTPAGKALAWARPPPARHTQLALIVTARLPADNNPQRLMAALTAEDLQAPAMHRARGPPLPRALARLARSVLAPPIKRARAGLTWSARLMMRAGRTVTLAKDEAGFGNIHL